MGIHVEDECSTDILLMLKNSYRFVSERWQHAKREPLPDQGFEERFREFCTLELARWTVSQPREMQFGSALTTASGVLHEIDIVLQNGDLTAVFELKNRPGNPPEKNDIIVFFAKMFDYLAYNPHLLLRETCPIFASSVSFEDTGLATCLGLGIHPIAPGLRPFPVLVDTVRLMDCELARGLVVDRDSKDCFEDLCAQVNNIAVTLSPVWLSNRCGYLSETSILLRAVGDIDSSASQKFRQINHDCSDLLQEFRRVKLGVGS